MSASGAAEPWSEGSEDEEDVGEHNEMRRQYWRDTRAKTGKLHQELKIYLQNAVPLLRLS